ncbi:NADH-ubiquinone oxidoreductase 21 subunit [Neolecta irregularis DAH-3]|uniref:NADH-ubiquinone oxidoreductase 21 subunit n=1 Tax=Neolecta irregularis (strain DAH-3) TaxID=1198029 RepID=A0A1U7LRR0_NEOID|nr:NADH-ubiquinone oxidoreductase 21 subunit [Neolecta irregularis DAH-3]|eukprot:OLL25360.1 NADH-ubiquinone oxidoreductase 21 subunit [Neolecta irregularis DAH-3]
MSLSWSALAIMYCQNLNKLRLPALVSLSMTPQLTIPPPYRPRDAVSIATQSALVGSAVGLTYSAVLTSLQTHSAGPWGVFRRTGRPILLLGGFKTIASSCPGIMGGAFSFVEAASANLREKDDSWNPFFGGCVAGFFCGLTRSLLENSAKFTCLGRSIGGVFGGMFGLGMATATVDWCGNAFTFGHQSKDPLERMAMKKKMFEVKDRWPKTEETGT